MKRKSSHLVTQKCTRTKLVNSSQSQAQSHSHSKLISQCTLQQAVRFVMERQGLVERFHICPSDSESKRCQSSRGNSIGDKRAAATTTTTTTTATVKDKSTTKAKISSPKHQQSLQSFDTLMPLHIAAQTTPPLSLLARVHNFQENHLITFLEQSRQSPLHYPMLRCMRSTLHLIPVSKYDLITGLYNFDGIQIVQQRLQNFGMCISSPEFKYISSKIIRILSSEGPMLTQALTVSMKAEEKKSTKYKVRNLSMQSGKATMTQSNVSVALHALFGQAQVQYGLASSSASSSSSSFPSSSSASSSSSSAAVSVFDSLSSSSLLRIPKESWTETRRLYGIASIISSSSDSKKEEEKENEKGQEEEEEEEEEESTTQAREYEMLTDLMRWYFELYSPASLQDFIWWSGRKVREARVALKTLLSLKEVKEIHVQGLSSLSPSMSATAAATATVPASACVCFVWTAHEEALLSTEDSLPTGVRFLPYEDAIIKAYKETRHRFYFCNIEEEKKEEEEEEEEEEENKVVTTNQSIQDLIFWKGEAYPTLWIDGQIVGRWKWKSVKKTTPSSSSGSSSSNTTTYKNKVNNKEFSPAPVISIMTRQKVSKKLQLRLLEELKIVCDMLECCPNHDVAFTVESE